jgi:hypothetical protein
MNKITSNIIGIIVGLLTVGIFFFALSAGIEKQSEVHCIKLQNQSEKYQDYYITESDDNFCQSIGIDIDAVVRDKNGDIIR